MFCFDKALQADRGQLFTDTGYIHAKSVIIHIKLVVPEKIYNVTAGTYFSCILEKIVEYFYLILVKSAFCPLYSMKPPSKCKSTPFQVCTSVCPEP